VLEGNGCQFIQCFKADESTVKVNDKVFFTHGPLLIKNACKGKHLYGEPLEGEVILSRMCGLTGMRFSPNNRSIVQISMFVVRLLVDWEKNYKHWFLLLVKCGGNEGAWQYLV